jgi:hypothetical protein
MTDQSLAEIKTVTSLFSDHTHDQPFRSPSQQSSQQNSKQQEN